MVRGASVGLAEGETVGRGVGLAVVGADVGPTLGLPDNAGGSTGGTVRWATPKASCENGVLACGRLEEGRLCGWDLCGDRGTTSVSSWQVSPVSGSHTCACTVYRGREASAHEALRRRLTAMGAVGQEGREVSAPRGSVMAAYSGGGRGAVGGRRGWTP
jgi:hypothetical protein